MEWISVKDEKPTNFYDCCEFLIVNHGVVYYAKWKAFRENQSDCDEWHDGQVFVIPNCDTDYGGLFIATDVTYWQPLPEPPTT